jgi:hypothetical protein
LATACSRPDRSAPTGDIEAAHEPGERRRVVRVDRSQRGRVRFIEIGARPGRELELGDVHAEHGVALHRVADLVRHRAKVLTHDDTTAAGGLDGNDREELLARRVDIHPVTGRNTVGYPEQALELHHVVEAEHAADPHVMAKARGEVLVAFGPARFRPQGWEPPVLTIREEVVRRRPGGAAPGEEVLVGPGVETVTMGAHGEIEVEVLTSRRQTTGQSHHLTMHGELRVEMPIHFGRVELVDIEAPLAGRLGPSVPTTAETMHRGAKPRVVDRVRSVAQERVERDAFAARVRRERGGQLDDHLATEPGLAPVVEAGKGTKRGDLLLSLG